MKAGFLENELRNIDFVEGCYRRIAELVMPSDLEENPVPLARAFMAALRGMERCVELRLKLVREAGRMPVEEPDEPLATVDLSRLSDEALREVEESLVPLDGPQDGEAEGCDRNELCEKNEEKTVSAAVALLRKGTAKAVPQAGRRERPAPRRKVGTGETGEKPLLSG